MEWDFSVECYTTINLTCSPFSSHFTAPVHEGLSVSMLQQPGPSTSNNDISSLMQLHSYSPSQEHVQATPSQTLVTAETVVNNKLSILDMYEDTNDKDEGGDEEDVINNELSVDDVVARTPLP